MNAAKKSDTANNHYIRTVEKEGENYKEKTEFKLTDTAVGVMAPIVLPATIPNYQTRQIDVSKDVETTPIEIIEKQPVDETHLNKAKNDTNSVGQNISRDKSSTWDKYFTLDGQTLVALNTDFKGSTWADQQRNFLTLYTKAYREIIGKAVPDKEHYKVAATRISIVDPNNFRNILTKLIKAKFTQLEEGFILNTDGEKDCLNILKLIQDENSKSGYAYSQKSSINTTKKHYLDKERKDLILTWVSADIDLGKLDIRNIKTGKEAGLLALWILTVHLKKANALLWNEAITYLLKKYDTLSVTSESARKAFIAKDNENVFQKNAEDQYFLSIDGQKLVEGWIDGSIELNKQTKK